MDPISHIYKLDQKFSFSNMLVNVGTALLVWPRKWVGWRSRPYLVGSADIVVLSLL